MAVAKRNPNELVLINADTGAITGRTPLPGVVRHLQLAAPGGPVLVPVESANALVRVDLPAGRAEPQIVTGTVPHDAAQAQNGYVFVANEHGGTVTVLRGDEMIKVFTGSVQPAGMAPVGLSMGMLDVRKNDLTVYDAAALTIVGVTPAGEGPTHLVADKHGRMIAADTRGDAVRVFEPLPKPREVGVVKQPVVSQEKWLQDRPNGRQNPQITRKVGLDSAPEVPACEIGTVLTVPDCDVRSLYLDQMRRDLTRYGMNELLPVGWSLGQRSFQNRQPHPLRMRNARSVSASATWA